MLHINRYLDRLKAANDRNQREFTQCFGDARDLHADITKLLVVLQDYHEKAMSAKNNTSVTIEMGGGSF